ncbi:hypothetical protein Tco_1144294 [Tanacetum coccineum]
MFIQAHDPDYVPEPIYPEYIPLEDEHEFPAEEQPLPPVDSPIAESPGYVTESDPEEDPKEYEDDETEDGLVDYPIYGGDDGDDDDGDSSRDDANDEDEDEDEEEEEHLAPADSVVFVPTDEPVSPPEGKELAEVERLLTMTTPSPSPPISLSPPSTGERLVRIASTQALIDAVTVTLPSPPLPPLPPSLYIPPPVDRRDDIPESEQPPTQGTVDAEERRQGIRDVGYGIREYLVDPAERKYQIAPMTVEEDKTRIVGDSMDGEGGGICFLIGRAPLDRIESGRPSQSFEDPPVIHVYAYTRPMSRQHKDTATAVGYLIQHKHHVHETSLFRCSRQNSSAIKMTDRRRQSQRVETLLWG